MNREAVPAALSLPETPSGAVEASCRGAFSTALSGAAVTAWISRSAPPVKVREIDFATDCIRPHIGRWHGTLVVAMASLTPQLCRHSASTRRASTVIAAA